MMAGNCIAEAGVNIAVDEQKWIEADLHKWRTNAYHADPIYPIERMHLFDIFFESDVTA